MTAYYNEIDPYAAQWLRNLIEAGLIAPGEVDTRSIVDVRSADLAGFDQCHFFAGLGGWSGALRLAGWSDLRPVWTGSCPCQPFSLAGKQKGFADDRHLWPVWRELIRERRPARVYGEQVASAAQWLRLVRGDLEALGYAVGAIPIEAASAGAHHLRDRYWFVANSDGIGCDQINPDAGGRGERGGAQQGAGLGRTCNGVGLADADDARSQGRWLLPECADQRLAGSDGVADTDQLGEGEGRQQRSGQLGGAGRDQEACGSGDVGHAFGSRARRDRGDGAGEETRSDCARREDGRGGVASLAPSAELEWVIGADGKARRVKSGVRLLAHGVPARVAKLRALGNAIDLRPAAAFIKATM